MRIPTDAALTFCLLICSHAVQLRDDHRVQLGHLAHYDCCPLVSPFRASRGFPDRSDPFCFQSLPITVGGALVFTLVIALPSWPSLKFRMLAGCALSMAGSLLLIFVENQSNYWKLALPGFFLGSAGALLFFAALRAQLVTDTTSPDFRNRGGLHHPPERGHAKRPQPPLRVRSFATSCLSLLSEG